MLFHLPADTECVLDKFVGRTQKSGPDDVPAVSFRLYLSSVSNEMLDLFSPTIRGVAYAPVEGQETLPGVTQTMPILRSKDLKHWNPETCLEGWAVVVARGITEATALHMATCKVDDFHFDFFEGGHMDVDFRVSSADLDEEGAGMLWGRQKRKVFVQVTAPELPPKSETIDGSVAAFERDHPPLTLFEDGGEETDDDADDEGEADPDDDSGPSLAADDPPKPKRRGKAKGNDATAEFIALNRAAGAH
jgi:hypothetical protein